MKRGMQSFSATQAASEVQISSGSSNDGYSSDESDGSMPSLHSLQSCDSSSSFSLSSSESDQPVAQRPCVQQNPIVWQNQDNIPQTYNFTGNPGVKANLDENSSPMEIFQKFITPALIDLIATEINRYAASTPAVTNSSRNRHDIPWTDVTVDEIKAVLALCLLMGIVRKPTLKMYWSRQEMIATPFFGDVMPGDRFQTILNNLHFADNDAQDDDRLFKIRAVLDVIIANFRTVFMPYQDISTDESLLKFHGRLRFKQYNSSKRARFGIKVYKVCQSAGPAAGYIWNMKVYCGRDSTNSSYPASTKVVMDLNQQLLDMGYNVYVDNWYSSPELFTKLVEAKTNVCVTVRLNRKHMPKDLSKVKLKKGRQHFGHLLKAC